jgi:addiction module HigA family antidote
MSKMHNPPHPGLILRDDVLPALGLTVTDAAKQLGVTRAALSRVLNERAAISPSMALHLVLLCHKFSLALAKLQCGQWPRVLASATLKRRVVIEPGT